MGRAARPERRYSLSGRGVSLARLDRRKVALRAIDNFQRDVETKADSLQAISDYYQNAFSMITSPETQKAFDLKQEKDSLRDSYGRSNIGGPS